MRDHCPCCGIPVVGAMGGKCFICRWCTGLHGDALQERMMLMVGAGVATGDDAIGVMAIDDAHIAGTLVIRAFNDDGTPKREGAELRVQRCPKRWEVYVARALAVNVTPDVAGTVHAAMLPHFGGRNTEALRQDLGHDVLSALCTIDPDVVGVDVTIEGDRVRHGAEIKFEIRKRVNVEPGAMVFGGAAIPAEVLGRKPAQA